jgi:hypothetical protein
LVTKFDSARYIRQFVERRKNAERPEDFVFGAQQNGGSVVAQRARLNPRWEAAAW